jgi:hypothetical protein
LFAHNQIRPGTGKVVRISLSNFGFSNCKDQERLPRYFDPTPSTPPPPPPRTEHNTP